MRMLRGIPSWGRCPQTPGIFRFAARMGCFWGAGCARPQPIPAAESALGLRSRSALSSAQVSPRWTTATLPCNDFSSDGDYPLNFVPQSRGSVQIASPFATHLTMPFRIMCTASTPCNVRHAVGNDP